MIRINRTARPKLDVYDKPSVRIGANKVSRAERELADALTFFTDHRNFKNEAKLTKKTFGFKVYKDKGLTDALAKVFGTNCAYCESNFGAVTPSDIEHFRPKSEVELEDGSSRAPGYFWLAGEWDNLLVSCPDCNRARLHEVPGRSGKVRLGKQARFPLSDETKRARNHSVGVQAEEPFRLLIDPCKDDPETLLRFDEDGMVWPLSDQPGLPRERALHSINVYALQRGKLVDQRREVLVDFKLKIELLRSSVTEFAKLQQTGAPAADIAAKTKQIELLKSALARFARKGAEYLGAIRCYVRSAKAAGTFDDLIRVKMDPEKLLTM